MGAHASTLIDELCPEACVSPDPAPAAFAALPDACAPDVNEEVHRVDDLVPALHAHSQAQGLYADALRCIGAFVAPTDMSTLLLVCRSWHIVWMNPHKTLRTPAQLQSFCLSPLRAGVRSLRLEEMLMMDAPAMSQLRAAIPHLQSLTVYPTAQWSLPPPSHLSSADRPAACTHVLPSRLCAITLRWPTTPGLKDVLCYMQSALEAVGAVPSISSVRIEYDAEDETIRSRAWDLSLSPLVRLPRLAAFHVSSFPYDVSALRQMHTLRTLHVTGGMSDSQLRRLNEEPHALNALEDIDMRRCDLRRRDMELVARFPALQVFEPRSLHPEAWSMLPRLPRLRALRLAVRRSDKDAAVACCEDLSFALSCLSHLTELSLEWWPAEGMLRRLLSAAPNLRKLTLHDVPCTSLSFLSACTQLHELRLQSTYSTSLRLDHFVALADLTPALHILRVSWFDAQWLEGEDRQRFQPPSALLPRLRVCDFDYQSRPESACRCDEL